MNRYISSALAACVLLSYSVASAQDFAPKILKYFPGKWEIKDANGASLGSVDWRLVANGKAVAGPSVLADGGAAFMLAGWDAHRKQWLHNWFEENGAHGHITVTKFEGNTWTGPMYFVAPDGKIQNGTFEGKIADENHCVITEVFGDEKVILHFYRKKG